MSSIAVSVIGASGYSGIELFRILRKHPSARIEHLFAHAMAGRKVHEINPWFRDTTNRVFETYAPEKLASTEVVFVALPSGEAMRIVPDLLSLGKRVIDLGGDFRLKDASSYTAYYKREHTAPKILSEAAYAIPELHAARLPDARLVANPGCYPTSAVIPLAPLLLARLIEPRGITINSLSGVSGAGRSSSVELSFAEVDGSVRPYKVGIHQHTPEIEATLSDAASTSVRVTFTPHLLPVTRGILTTTTAQLTPAADLRSVTMCLEKAYQQAPFVRLLGDHPPELRSVVHSNYIDIGWHLYERNGQIIVMSAIDNLVKGAAGQAVQNFNLMCGHRETEGLL